MPIFSWAFKKVSQGNARFKGLMFPIRECGPHVQASVLDLPRRQLDLLDAAGSKSTEMTFLHVRHPLP